MRPEYYTKISSDEMILARTDDRVLTSILERLQPYAGYIAEIMYRAYGGDLDHSISREDLHSYCMMNFLIAIKKYYHPKRYRKSKDKNKTRNYQDGFGFICQIAKYRVKSIWRLRRWKKRIPLQHILSLDAPINTELDNSPTIGDMLVTHPIEKKDSYILDLLLCHLKKHDKIMFGISTYDITKCMLEYGFDAMELSKRYGIPVSKVREIMVESVVHVLKDKEL